jgi:hypothetical protein
VRAVWVPAEVRGRLVPGLLRRNLSFLPIQLFEEVRPKALAQGVAHKDHDYRERHQERRPLERVEPPLRSKTNAITPITAPQARYINLFGSVMPPTDIWPSTMVPASALAARKIRSTKIDTN